METTRLIGEWWVAGTNTRKWGTLEWKPREAARLEIAGRLSGYRWDRDFEPGPPTILGQTRTGERVTLMDNLVLSSTPDRDDHGPGAEVISSAMVFVGVHVEDEAANVASVRLGSPVLDWWLETDSFEVEEVDPDDKSRRQLTYRHPDPIELLLSDGKVVLESLVLPSAWIGGRSLVTRTWAVVERGAPAPLSEYWGRSVGPISSYLSFATARSVRPSYVGIQFEGHSQEAYLLSPDVVHLSEDERIHFASNAPVTRYTVGDRIIKLTRRWLEVPVDKQGIHDTYLGLVDSPTPFGDVRFLLLMTGLEAFWRSDLSHPVIPKNEHDARLAKVLDACPEDHRDWLRDKLQHSNEPAQRIRLEEVCREVWPDLLMILKDAASFLRIAVDTRNFLVHGDYDNARRAERDPLRLAEDLCGAHPLG